MDNAELQNMMLQKVVDMPNKARRVTEFLLSNMREAAFRPIGDVADELHVSKAQLVRVARLLGFDGYADLKSCLQSAILEQINPAAMLTKAVGMKDELPQNIFQAERANIEDTWTQYDHEKVVSFCEMAKNAKNVVCIAWGISSLVMELAYDRFCVMGLQSSFMKRGSLSLIEQARFVHPDSLVLTCEMPSYAIEVTEAVEEMKNRGAKVVTITDSPAAPVCRFADISFLASATSPTFGASIIGAIFLVHLLTSSLVVHLGEPARLALERQADYLHDERFYHKIFGLKY